MPEQQTGTFARAHYAVAGLIGVNPSAMLGRVELG
jgi:hypothetical protein